MAEAEVAVARGRDRLDGEVQRIDPRHPRALVVVVQHDHRGGQQDAGSRQGGIKRRVEVIEHDPNGVERSPQPGAPCACSGRLVDLDAAIRRLIDGPDRHRPVAGVHLLIPSRTCNHLTGGGGVLAANDRYRCQFAVDLAQCPVAGCFAAGGDEFDAGGLERMGGVLQAGLDNRRCREFGNVENPAGAVVVGYRGAQHVVSESRDHTHLGVGSSCQQRDFEICRVVIPCADNCDGARDFGSGELASNADVGELRTVQLDNTRAGPFQLVDNRCGQRIVTADNDVMMHALIRHSGIPDRDRVQDRARGDTRFADAVTVEGYTTALSRPALPANFAGAETHSSRKGDWATAAMTPESFAHAAIRLAATRSWGLPVSSQRLDCGSKSSVAIGASWSAARNLTRT